MKWPNIDQYINNLRAVHPLGNTAWGTRDHGFRLGRASPEVLVEADFDPTCPGHVRSLKKKSNPNPCSPQNKSLIKFFGTGSFHRSHQGEIFHKGHQEFGPSQPTRGEILPIGKTVQHCGAKNPQNFHLMNTPPSFANRTSTNGFR